MAHSAHPSKINKVATCARVASSNEYLFIITYFWHIISKKYNNTNFIYKKTDLCSDSNSANYLNNYKNN